VTGGQATFYKHNCFRAMVNGRAEAESKLGRCQVVTPSGIEEAHRRDRLGEGTIGRSRARLEVKKEAGERLLTYEYRKA
jgi:hypothetical protein